MTSYAVERTITARPEVVWALLTDAPRYPEWNPAVLGIEGAIAAGSTIQLKSIVNPKRTFKLKVESLEAPKSMVWSDGMPLGLFKGARTFLIEPTDGGTRFHMEEVYSGPLAPLITRVIPDMTESFEMFADGLKAAAESNG